MSNRSYKFPDNEHQHMNARLIYITEAKYGEDWNSDIHTHHFTELFYILRGKGFFTISDHSFPIRENHLIIVNPNVPHMEISSKTEPLEYIILGINNLEFHNTENSDYNLLDFSFHKDELNFYLKSLLREVRFKEPNFENVCQNLLEIIVWYIIRKTKLTLAAASSKKSTKECHFIEQYLQEHFKEDISLQTLSELTYLNKYYLVHAFKNYKGLSPMNYMIQLRIDEAKYLLETTNTSIAKIASQIGFSSQSYFSQTFRRMTGMTPNEYRKAADARK